MTISFEISRLYYNMGYDLARMRPFSNQPKNGFDNSMYACIGRTRGQPVVQLLCHHESLEMVISVLSPSQTARRAPT